MNRNDPSDDDLRAAFGARLAGSAEPSARMLQRTLAAIDAVPNPPAASRWTTATHWWLALAAPARFALAATIVIVAGTIGLGTFKVARERAGTVDTPQGSRLTLDRRPARAAQLAHDATLRLTVPDVASTVGRIAAIARHASGVCQQCSAQGIARQVRVVLEVPALRRDSTLAALATLGRVDGRLARQTDLTFALAAIEAELRAARTAPPADPRAAAERDRLERRHAALQRRIATSTIVVVVRYAPPTRTALTIPPLRDDEPGLLALRPTSTALARGSPFAPDRSFLAWHRVRALDRAALRVSAARRRAARAAA